MKHGKPMTFFSECLGPKNMAQSIYEKDKMTILEALKKLRPYFLATQPIINTFQQSSEFLGSPRQLEGIQHKLMLRPLEFDYKFKYKRDLMALDALSKQFQSDGIEI
jgi:hypothetical protein